MIWIKDNAAELAAIGSILMNISTLAIIFFNMHQVRLNRRSLNIDINFKVFETRKKIYRDIENKDGGCKINNQFQDLKIALEDSKYLFSKELFSDLEKFLLLCEQGVSLECEIQSIKDQNIDHWLPETTAKLQDLTNERKKVIDGIYGFNIKQFTKYLNVSNFHKDFINESDMMFKSRFLSLIRSIGVKLWSILIYNKNSSAKKSASKILADSI